MTDPQPARDDVQVRPLTATRRVVARRMAESARDIPAVTLHRQVDFATLLRQRADTEARMGTRIILDALLASVTARALLSYDLLNAHWDADAFAVAVFSRRDIAIAVDTPHGLTAVVLRAADSRDAADLSTDLARLVERAVGQRSALDDLRDPTFTITNLGGLGVESFTPMITPNQTAVLGVGTIGRAADGTRSGTLSLTFDHRAADGAYAARFLAHLADMIQHAATDSPQ